MNNSDLLKTRLSIAGLIDAAIPWDKNPDFRTMPKQERNIIEYLNTMLGYPIWLATQIVTDAVTEQVTTNRGGTFMFLQADYFRTILFRRGFTENRDFMLSYYMAKKLKLTE